MIVKTASLSVTLALATFISGGVYAEDAMAPASGAMATEAMAPMMSEDDLAKCVAEAKAISFTEVAMAAEQACHTLHNGGTAMGGDAMMGGDAIAPKQ